MEKTPIQLTLPEKNRGYFEEKTFSSKEAAQRHVRSRLKRAAKSYWGLAMLENIAGTLDEMP